MAKTNHNQPNDISRIKSVSVIQLKLISKDKQFSKTFFRKVTSLGTSRRQEGMERGLIARESLPEGSGIYLFICHLLFISLTLSGLH